MEEGRESGMKLKPLAATEGPKGDFGGQTDKRTDGRTDKRFKGVRYILLYILFATPPPETGRL